MITATETARPLTQSAEYRKYEVDSRRFNFEIGDLVTPETIIGWHHESGQLVRADLHGHVATGVGCQ
jgi:hypothetical protein